MVEHAGSTKIETSNAAPEDRRLKALGLAALGLSIPLFYALSADAANQWPPNVHRLGPFVIVSVLALNLVALGLMWLSVGCGGLRPWRNAASRRAWTLKFAIANLVVPPLVYNLLFDGEQAAVQLKESGWDTALSVPGMALVLGAMWLFRRSRRHEARSAAQAMAADSRRPVLYLRSFRDDGSMLIDDHGWPLVRRLMGLLSPTSAEEELADVLERIGPVVAIGKPGEPLPELGAARLYVGHDVWQAEVGALMDKAALVVVRVGASPGVLWEIEQALEHLPRERLALVVLGGAPLAPQITLRLAPVLGTALQAVMPVRQRGRVWWAKPNRSIGAVVCFKPGDGAHVVPVRSWPMALTDLGPAMVMRPSAGPLRRAWRQVFALLGLAWGMAPQRHRRFYAVLLAIGFGGCGAHWFYLGRRRRGWIYVLTFPLAVPFFMAWFDALRFIWVDQAEFESRFASAVH